MSITAINPETSAHASASREAVRDHYNELVSVYESLWGEHIHHGYWDGGGEGVDRHTAQRRTVLELVAFADFPAGGTVLDAGCGIGAPAIYLAGAMGCRVEGITLSPEQVERAGEKAHEAGVAGLTNFRVLDALRTDFPDESFDAVWALESLELMPDKEAFFTEAMRVLRPGGTLAVTTWCTRDDERTEEEEALIRRINHNFAIPYMLPLPRYQRMCEALGFVNVRTADWTDRVRPTWSVDSELFKKMVSDRRYLLQLARDKGVSVIRLLDVIPVMGQAYDCGAMRYGALRATKS